MRLLANCLLGASLVLTSGGAGAAPKTPPAAAAPAASAAPAAPATEDDRTLYALGLVIGRNLGSFGLTPAELQIVKAGIDAQVTGTPPAVDLATYGPKIQPLQAARVHALSEREQAAGAAYLETAAAAPGAVRTASGAVVQTITAGEGASPTAADKVRVHYDGHLIDGTLFDSSRTRGEPATMALTGVIPCWTEAVPLMKVGGRSRVVCPAKLAYGERGSGPLIHPGATLVFDIELLAVNP